MSIIALLCIVVSLAVVQKGMRRQGTSNTFLKLFAVCLVVSVVFTTFFSTGRRTASRVRSSVEARMRHRDEIASKRHAARLASLPAPPDSPWSELPTPPAPPTPVHIDGAIKIDGSSDGDDDAGKDASEAETPDSKEWESVQSDVRGDHHPRPARDGWDGLSDRFTTFFEKVADRSTGLAERAAARADSLRARVEQFRTEVADGVMEDEDAASENDDASHDNDASQVDEDTDAERGHHSPSHRGPGMLAMVLASSAILYVGYLFLDANTRGQFTWSLRIASLFAFAGIIAAVFSLT